MNQQNQISEVSPSLSHLISAIEKLLKDLGMEATQHRLSKGNIDKTLPPNGPKNLFNIIPSDSHLNSVCCNLVIAIANGSRGKRGLCQVMQQLRSHLILCADASKCVATKSVLIIYDKESNRVFWESKKDFQTHKQHNGVYFFRLFWDGRHLNQMAMPK